MITGIDFYLNIYTKLFGIMIIYLFFFNYFELLVVKQFNFEILYSKFEQKRLPFK